MRRISAILTMASLTSAIWGCSQAAKLDVRPGVRMAYRNALLDKSKVVNVTNSGSKPLFDVRIWAQGWDTSLRIANQLDVGTNVEIGWMELPRGFKPGETIYISADGNALPPEAMVRAVLLHALAVRKEPLTLRLENCQWRAAEG